MHSKDKSSQTQVVNTVEREGQKLDIVARQNFEGDWELGIVNELGVATNWLEFFDSAEAALAAGLAAIDEEGLQEFVSIEGFEYLNDLPASTPPRH